MDNVVFVSPPSQPEHKGIEKKLLTPKQKLRAKEKEEDKARCKRMKIVFKDKNKNNIRSSKDVLDRYIRVVASGKFQIRIWVTEISQQVSFGYYDTIEEARIHRDVAERRVVY